MKRSGLFFLPLFFSFLLGVGLSNGMGASEGTAVATTQVGGGAYNYVAMTHEQFIRLDVIKPEILNFVESWVYGNYEYAIKADGNRPAGKEAAPAPENLIPRVYLDLLLVLQKTTVTKDELVKELKDMSTAIGDYLMGPVVLVYLNELDPKVKTELRDLYNIVNGIANRLKGTKVSTGDETKLIDAAKTSVTQWGQKLNPANPNRDFNSLGALLGGAAAPHPFFVSFLDQSLRDLILNSVMVVMKEYADQNNENGVKSGLQWFIQHGVMNTTIWGRAPFELTETVLTNFKQYYPTKSEQDQINTLENKIKNSTVVDYQAAAVQSTMKDINEVVHIYSEYIPQTDPLVLTFCLTCLRKLVSLNLITDAEALYQQIMVGDKSIKATLIKNSAFAGHHPTIGTEFTAVVKQIEALGETIKQNKPTDLAGLLNNLQSALQSLSSKLK